MRELMTLSTKVFISSFIVSNGVMYNVDLFTTTIFEKIVHNSVVDQFKYTRGYVATALKDTVCSLVERFIGS